MRFTTFASAAALVPTLVSAATYHSDLKEQLGNARVHNKCNYPVYLWSVKKDEGCEEGKMTKLKPGESYSEKYRDDFDEVGVSIKISKTDQCKGLIATGEEFAHDITQLEYHINHDNPDFLFNFLDVSFVDCLHNKCPARDKFCLKSGNNGDVRLATAGADKAICPILSCSSIEECSTMAYVLPDDIQTKTCEPAADMDFYLCTDSCDGDDEPSYPDEEPAPSSSEKEEEKPEPTSAKVEEKPTPAKEEVKEAEITPAPKDEAMAIKEKKIKTEVVYVTKYEYVNAKRNVHGHQHQHRQFRA